eukprot:scaffold38715_cov31-Tisochrysis_lutea.AAC.7
MSEPRWGCPGTSSTGAEEPGGAASSENSDGSPYACTPMYKVAGRLEGTADGSMRMRSISSAPFATQANAFTPPNAASDAQLQANAVRSDSPPSVFSPGRVFVKDAYTSASPEKDVSVRRTPGVVSGSSGNVKKAHSSAVNVE